MKRSFVILLLLLICLCRENVLAQSQFSPVITKMENSLFGIDYKNQNDELRLKRIEERVYGTTSSKPISQRIAKLSQDLVADQIGQEIKPREDTFADEDAKYKEDTLKADSNVNYPIVNKLEDQVFGKENKTLDINKRLANLEQKAFKKTYNDDLNARVERLKAAVLPREKTVDTNDSFDTDSIFDQDYLSQDDYLHESPKDKHNNYNAKNSVLDDYKSGSDITVPLAALERSVLRKSYPDDTVSNRLSRMEAIIFHSSFTQDDPETRMDRISSANRAKKSAKKYDNNKTSQHMATAMQLGALLLMVLAVVL